MTRTGVLKETGYPVFVYTVFVSVTEENDEGPRDTGMGTPSREPLDDYHSLYRVSGVLCRLVHDLHSGNRQSTDTCVLSRVGSDSLLVGSTRVGFNGLVS